MHQEEAPLVRIAIALEKIVELLSYPPIVLSKNQQPIADQCMPEYTKNKYDVIA